MTPVAYLDDRGRLVVDLRAIVRALMPARPDTEGWVRVASYTAGVVPRRVANAAAACGSIVGATKRGKYWVAQRASVDAWLASGPADVEASDRVASWARRVA